MANVISNTPYDNHITEGVEGVYKWDTTEITYRFAVSEDEDIILQDWILDGNETLSYLTENILYQNFVNAIMVSMDAYAHLIPISFTENDDFATSDFKFIGVENLPFVGMGNFPATNYNQHNGEYESYMILDGTYYYLPAEVGGSSFNEFLALHEMGHMLGLAHPHDHGLGSDSWTIVDRTHEDDVLDNARYTIMSYEAGGEDVILGNNYGHVLTPSAIDIAALHHMYGANMNAYHGNTIYSLTDAGSTARDIDGDDGTISIGRAYYTIWDTGGTDQIRYEGQKNAYINLIDAPLVHEDSAEIEHMIAAVTSTNRFDTLPDLIREDIRNHDYHAGGFISRIFEDADSMQVGGYGIAQGAKIENAYGGDGDDILIGNNYQNILSGAAGEDLIYGGVGADFLNGGTGDDIIWGASGGDQINADSGDDIINGGTEKDIINAGSGHDVIVDNDLGRDLIWGGSGFDTVSYLGTGQSMVIDLTVTDGATNFNDYLESVENIIGTDFDDMITGNNERNILEGQGGDDTLYGGVGGDFLYGGNGIDTILGGQNSDQIYGGDDADLIDGGTAKDIIHGDNGDDIIFDTDHARDIIYGGAGFDIVTFLGSDQSVTIDLTQEDASSFGDYFHSIEGVMTTNFDDIISGNDEDNLISAEEGNDFLYGAGGADILSGGLGDDTYFYNDISDTTVTSWDVIADFETGSDILSLGFDLDISDLLIQTASGQSLVTVAHSDFAILVNDIIHYDDIHIA